MRTRLSLLIFLVSTGSLAAVVPACSCSGDDTTASTGVTTTNQAFDSVVVEPADVVLTVDLDGSATQTYQAFGVAGSERTDITASCSWVVDTAFGTMTSATLTALPHGGTTQVIANCSELTGTSNLTVNVTGTVISGPNTPPNAPDLFDTATPTTDPAFTPAILYPIDRAVAPLNIPSVDVQWTAAQNDLFHVAFTSPNLTVDLYTTDISGMLSQEHWMSVAGTAAGQDLSLVVEGLVQADPSKKFVSAPVVLKLSHDTIDKTAIYYWASSQGSIMTQVFGSTTSPTAVKADCTSCHSVSRTGRRIGYSRCVGGSCGDIRVGFMKYDKPSDTWIDTVDANTSTILGSYSTFAPAQYPFPNDDQTVALVTMNTGRLDLYDPDTGAPVPSNVSDVSTHEPGSGAPVRAALMPDWSPDGMEIVFTSTPYPGQWIDLADGRIAVMSYSYMGGTHTFGEPTYLVPGPIDLPSGTYTNFFFPSYSPDGSYIVFNAARAQWRNFSIAGSPGQRLMLTDAAGSFVVELAAMNGEGDLDITWPHWAPGNTTDYLWIVFSSERDYGHKVTVSNSNPACVANGVQQCKQLWIGAVDKAALANGTIDPSAPPVWLPGQDIGADNISPYWTIPTSEIPQ